MTLGSLKKRWLNFEEIIPKQPLTLVPGTQDTNGIQIIIDKEPLRRYIFESVSLREFFDFMVKENNIFSLRYGIGR